MLKELAEQIISHCDWLNMCALIMQAELSIREQMKITVPRKERVLPMMATHLRNQARVQVERAGTQYHANAFHSIRFYWL